jgi:hypothetical protein
MKRYLIIAMMCLAGLAVQAQTKVLINFTDGTTKEYNIETVDEMVWDKITVGGEPCDGLIIYLSDKTKEEYAVSMIEDIKWDKKSTGNQTIVKNDILLTNPETFIVNDKLREVKSRTCTINLGSVALTTDTKLVVRESVYSESLKEAIDKEIDEEPSEIGNNAKVIDLELEGIHELNGVAVIRIPFTPTGKMPGAAYYNEDTKEWEPVCSYYDKDTKEMVIITDHFTSFSAFDVKNEQTRNAWLKFTGVPDEDINPETQAIVISKIGLNMEGLDWIAKTYNDLPMLAKDLGISSLQMAGFDTDLMDKVNKRMKYASVAFSAYEVCRAYYKGEYKEGSYKALQTIIGLANDKLMDELVIQTCSGAAGFSVALISYSLTKMFEAAWTSRKDFYKKMYDLYYAPNNTGTLPSHYMDEHDWYKKIMPLYEQKDITPGEVNEKVLKMVKDYAREFWDLENSGFGDFELYWTEVGGAANKYKGGINDAIRKELSDNKIASILDDVLPKAYEMVNNALFHKAFQKAREKAIEYARLMNKKCIISIQDGLAFTQSDYAGYKVRFKDLSNTELKDPEKWECTLDDMGKGKIMFRLYPYLHEGVKPLLEVVAEKDGKEEVLQEIPITISEDNNQNVIDLSEGKMYGFIQVDVTKESVERTETDYSSPLFWKESNDALYVEIFTYYDKDGEGNMEKGWLAELPVDWDAIDLTIIEVFPLYGDLTVGDDGTIGVNNEFFTISGAYIPMDDGKTPKSGTGTFKLKYDKTYKYKTVDDVTAFWRDPTEITSTALGRIKHWHPFLDARINQTVEGIFTFDWDSEKEMYVFHFTGKGPYLLEGNVYNQMDGVDPMAYEFGGGYWGKNPYAVCVGTEGVSIEGETTIDIEMTYVFRLPPETSEDEDNAEDTE